jgi:hypothetical protein
VHLETFGRRKRHLLHDKELPIRSRAMTARLTTCSVFP